MKKFRWLILTVVFLGLAGNFLLVASENGKNDKSQFTGIWQGKLKVSGLELRIVFNIEQDSSGNLTATMDSPDQGASGIPVSGITINSDSIRIEVRVANGYYTGKLETDSVKIEGQWHQSGMDLPLSLQKIQKVEKPKRPQEPRKPYPYREENVTYPNTEAGIRLAGTLTLPRAGNPFPAVILISGSGPQDRDETLMGHKPFWVLADYLTRRGIAVLRVDDRGVGKSTGNFATATSKDFAGDVEAGAAYLRSRNDIDHDKIGLIGHSEGGLIAPMVAAADSGIAFIVLMAGPGLPGKDILKMQTRLILQKSGVSKELIEKNEKAQARLFKIMESTKESEKSLQLLEKTVREIYNQFSPEEKKSLGISDSDKSISLQAKQLNSPWLRYFLQYDPRPTLEKVKCPVLAIIGQKDVQVPAKANLDMIRAALQVGGNSDFTVKELKGLNHLLQTAKTGLPSEYGTIEETISPTALKTIGDWVTAHAGLSK